MIMDYANSHFSEKDIVFIDNIDHDNLLDFYNSLSLFVLPSYYEALGCVYLEAAACGVPFIGVKGQGIDEWVPEKQKDLFLCNPKSVDSLSDLIKKHFKERYNFNKLNFNLSIDHHISNFLKFIQNID